ncbi:hypothetical protein A4X13_0g3083 [Tilletia indica]|uniref:Uncharacterized protein n=1 Tax=Tilletia indica TaxID=43049 RepID=A0A177TPN3_9BASI|nr:hypothetical protein A4X13_0g3083 [Tilletia indica]
MDHSATQHFNVPVAAPATSSVTFTGVASTEDHHLAALGSNTSECVESLKKLRLALLAFGECNIAELSIMKAEIGLDRLRNLCIKPALVDDKKRQALFTRLQDGLLLGIDQIVSGHQAVSSTAVTEVLKCVRAAQEGLADVKRGFNTMSSIRKRHTFKSIVEAADTIANFLNRGSTSSDATTLDLEGQHWPGPFEELNSLVLGLVKRIKLVEADHITERMQRELDMDLARYQQEGLMIALVAAVAAQSVSFVASTSSTTPQLDGIVLLLVLSATVLGVSGALSYAVAYMRLTSATALPTHMMRPRLLMELVHGGLFLFGSLGASVLFTVAGLTCFAWMQLHPRASDAPPSSDNRTNTFVEIAALIIIGLPALASVLAFALRAAWSRYEMCVANIERRKYLVFKDPETAAQRAQDRTWTTSTRRGVFRG